MPPNLVLVTVDSLRPDRLSCYGGPDGIGTAICGLARSGTLYSWAISPSPFTAVALASIFTSRYPSEHGVTAFASSALPTRAVTLAETLRSAGYSTGAFVGTASLNRGSNLHQGFDIYHDRQPPHSPTSGAGDRPAADRPAALLTRAALGFAGQAAEPWFIWVHYGDPRGPYAPLDTGGPVAQSGMARSTASSRGQLLPLLADHSGRGGIPAYQIPASVREPDDSGESADWANSRAARGPLARPGSGESAVRVNGPRALASNDLLRRYDSEIRAVDRQLGRLLEGLEALGHPGVIVTADHGEALGEDDYWFAHGHSVGLDQIWVPLVWRPPPTLDSNATSRRGRIDPRPVSTLDIAPTLLASAKLPKPTAFEGVPLDTGAAPAARTGAQPETRERRIFAEHPLRAAVVANGIYYARDRQPLAEPVPDPIRGGTLHALPARFAELGDDASTGPYRPAAWGGPTAREAVSDTAEARSKRNAAEDETRRAIRALEAALTEFIARTGATPLLEPDAHEPARAGESLEAVVGPAVPPREEPGR